VQASNGSVHVWYALKADVEIGILALARWTFADYGAARKIDRFSAAHRAAVDKHDKAAIAAAQRALRYWSARRGIANLVEAPADRTHIHFGIVVRREDGRTQAFRIVGEDEADTSRGTVSHVSPLARALIGRSVGDVVTVLARKTENLEIH
jgi:transcription elongation GreA/GreB family factor